MYDFLGFAGRTCMILVQEQRIHDAENKLKKKNDFREKTIILDKEKLVKKR
jgi:hypothetical protein